MSTQPNGVLQAIRTTAALFCGIAKGELDKRAVP